jgi:transcription initiation protein SPT3
MMFVSGETGDPSPETTTMIEGIVQQQVIEMVRYNLLGLQNPDLRSCSSSEPPNWQHDGESEPSVQTISYS